MLYTVCSAGLVSAAASSQEKPPWISLAPQRHPRGLEVAGGRHHLESIQIVTFLGSSFLTDQAACYYTSHSSHLFSLRSSVCPRLPFCRVGNSGNNIPRVFALSAVWKGSRYVEGAH